MEMVRQNKEAMFEIYRSEEEETDRVLIFHPKNFEDANHQVLFGPLLFERAWTISSREKHAIEIRRWHGEMIDEEMSQKHGCPPIIDIWDYSIHHLIGGKMVNGQGENDAEYISRWLERRARFADAIDETAQRQIINVCKLIDPADLDHYLKWHESRLEKGLKFIRKLRKDRIALVMEEVKKASSK